MIGSLGQIAENEICMIEDGGKWWSPKPREQEDSDAHRGPNVCAPEAEWDLCTNSSPLILYTAPWCRHCHITDFTYGKNRGSEKINYFPS